MWSFHVSFVLFLVIVTSIASAQMISNDKDCSNGYKTAAYEIVKNVLASKITSSSIDHELRKLSDRCAQKACDLDSSMLFNQTQKMLWLKDEVQKIKEKILNKLNKDLKVFKCAVENKLSAKDVQLSLRMTRLTETISNMTREINSLESSNIGQNTRL